ncbi:MAG: hypothetical protein RIR28_401 [Pseudomonadota bacterium]|jgi:hypothetical protein
MDGQGPGATTPVIGQACMTTPDSLPIRLGQAFHRLMEFAEHLPAQTMPEADWHRGRWGRLLAPYALPREACAEVGACAVQIVSAPDMRDLLGLDTAQAVAWAEREWPDASGGWIRPDRVVWLPDCQAVRIIDFKWRLLPGEEADYAAQLRGYRAIIAPGATAHIVTADGGHWMLAEEGLVHCPSAGRPAL